MYSHRNRQPEVLLDIVQIQFQGKTISMSPLLTGGNKVEFDYVNKNKGIKMYSINFLDLYQIQTQFLWYRSLKWNANQSQIGKAFLFFQYTEG